MQEIAVLPLSQECLHAIKNQQNADRQVYKELVDHMQIIKDLLISYHFAKRERIIAVHIDELSIRIDEKGQGSFSVYYTIGMFNACADIDHQNEESMKIDLNVNLSTLKATLKGEFWPEREPDDL